VPGDSLASLGQSVASTHQQPGPRAGRAVPSGSKMAGWGWRGRRTPRCLGPSHRAEVRQAHPAIPQGGGRADPFSSLLSWRAGKLASHFSAVLKLPPALTSPSSLLRVTAALTGPSSPLRVTAAT